MKCRWIVAAGFGFIVGLAGQAAPAFTYEVYVRRLVELLRASRIPI
jgi:hypothetical protein